MWAAETSLGLPYLDVRIDLALAYPSYVKGSPSINNLTFLQEIPWDRKTYL